MTASKASENARLGMRDEADGIQSKTDPDYFLGKAQTDPTLLNT